MRKKMYKLIKRIHFNKNMFVFLFSFILIGIISGSIFSLMLSENDKILVNNYLNSFINNLPKKSIKLDISSNSDITSS